MSGNMRRLKFFFWVTDIGFIVYWLLTKLPRYTQHHRANKHFKGVFHETKTTATNACPGS